jgi:hypothetical protein
MANVTYSTKKVIVNGIVTEVTVEHDPNTAEMVKRFETASNIQRRLGFNIDAASNCVNGKGKHTGSMSKAKAAQGVKGACSRKTWNKRKAEAEQRKLSRKVA